MERLLPVGNTTSHATSPLNHMMALDREWSNEGLAEEAMECASASVLKAAKMEHTRYVVTRYFVLLYRAYDVPQPFGGSQHGVIDEPA